MFIRLDNENSFYRSGETVKGTVFFQLFHQSVETELFIKFEGVQIVPKHIKTKIIGGEPSVQESIDESSMSSSQRNRMPKKTITIELSERNKILSNEN